MRRSLLWALAAAALGSGLGACGKTAPRLSLPKASAAPTAKPGQVAIAVATKNTTRLGGADPASDAASVAQAVYPGLTAATRPQAVVVVDDRNWPAALAAAALASAPLGAPLLYAHGQQLPAVTDQALRAMHPVGAPALGGAQVIRVATAAAVPGGYRTRTVRAAGGPAGVAASVQRLLLRAQGKAPRQVIVLATSAPRALQMPAAGLAAESGAPILFSGNASVPAPTASVLTSLKKPAIYLLGASAVSPGAMAALGRFGRVTKIAEGSGGSAGGREASDPVANAVSVSRFSDGSFGWGIREAGHGLVFVNSARALDAPAAAPLSAHGDYAPLLLLSDRASVPPALTRYLSDIEPGYTATVGPVREVYNHGWLLGDESAISARVQAEIDAILEVAPRASAAEPSVPAPE
jgi:putative cell wall binding repeat protein